MEAKFALCAPLVEVVFHGICLKSILVDGRVGVNVVTGSRMEILGLQSDRQSKCNRWMASKERVKLERVITTVNNSILRITTTLDFQVIQSDIEAYPMILGQPWLKNAHASKYWKDS